MENLQIERVVVAILMSIVTVVVAHIGLARHHPGCDTGEF